VIYDVLARFAPDGATIEMKLAESVTPSADYKTWTVKLRRGMKWSDGSPFTIERARPHKGYLVVKLVSIDSMAHAEALRGRYLEIPWAEAAPLPPGQYYRFPDHWPGGMDPGGRLPGKVADILLTGSNDVYLVRGRHGEVLVPAGNYLTGAIALRSNTLLRMEQDATIMGTPDLADYPVTEVRWEGKWIHYSLRKEAPEKEIKILLGSLVVIANDDAVVKADQKKLKKYLNSLKLDKDVIDHILDTIKHHSGRKNIIKAKTPEARKKLIRTIKQHTLNVIEQVAAFCLRVGVKNEVFDFYLQPLKDIHFATDVSNQFEGIASDRLDNLIIPSPV
jgi:ribosomal 30S subunit maturation factor RimM